MNSNQPDMFAEEFKDRQREKRFAAQRKAWRMCWDWPGPKVGGRLEVGEPCVKDVDGNVSYWYCAPCIALEQLGPDKWLVIVDYDAGAPEHCRVQNGTKLVLETDEIWAPTKQLWAEYHAKKAKEQN